MKLLRIIYETEEAHSKKKNNKQKTEKDYATDNEVF